MNYLYYNFLPIVFAVKNISKHMRAEALAP